MSSKHRSINERLQRARSPSARAETLRDWVDNWEDDARGILDLLNDGIRTTDRSMLTSASGELRTMIDKRFDALRSVLERLAKQDNTTGDRDDVGRRDAPL